MTILKRTLTLKSRLWFGKYTDLTIQDIISLNDAQYLRWVYYNNSVVDYIQELFELIGIPEDFKIAKPGTDKIRLYQLKSHLMGKMTDKEKMVDRVKKRTRQKTNVNLSEMKINRKSNNKKGMQLKNQGH